VKPPYRPLSRTNNLEALPCPRSHWLVEFWNQTGTKERELGPTETRFAKDRHYRHNPKSAEVTRGGVEWACLEYVFTRGFAQSQRFDNDRRCATDNGFERRDFIACR